jgi:hypothetical protein
MASNSSRLAQEVINYTNEIKKLREELSKTKNGTADYEITQRKLSNTIEQGKKATDRYLESLSKLNKNVYIQNVAFDKGNKVVKNFNDTVGGSSKSISSLAGNFVKTIATVGKFFLAYQALNLVISGVKELVVGSVQEFIKLEDTLGKVQAVTGSSSSQMDTLKGAILSTAIETRFTATEIADLAVSLGKLGATSGEIPQLIKPIATAAQAIGEDITAVGEAVLKANNQFQISSENSAVTAAVLTNAITDSALSLSSFNTALQYVGPLANQVGLGIDAASGYMKVLADNGFTASKIGTGLRNIFIELKESGVPLTETIRNLANQNISLSEAVELVGKRSAAQLITLIENIDAVENYTTATEALVGVLAAEAAQMSTTKAQLDILNTAYTNFKISIGEAINSSELLIEIIGILDRESEELARGQEALNEILSDDRGAQIFQKALEDATKYGVDPLITAINVLRDSGKAADNSFVQFFDELQSKAGLSADEALRVATSFADDRGAVNQKKIRQSLNLQREDLVELNKLFSEYGGLLSDLDEGLDYIEGINKALKNQGDLFRSQQAEEAIAASLQEEYQARIDSIKEKSKEGLVVEKEVSQLRKDMLEDQKDDKDLLADKINKLNTYTNELDRQVELGRELTLEEIKYLATQKSEIKNLQIRINSYDRVLDSSKELADRDADNVKAQERAQIERVRANAAEFKDRIKVLEDEARGIKKKYDKEVADAKKLYELRIEGVEDYNVIKQAEDDLNKQIAESEERRLAGIASVYTEIGNIYTEAEKARSEFVAEAQAKGFDEEQIEKITEVYDKFKKSTKSLFETLIELETELTKDQFDQVEGPLRQAAASAELFSEKLAALRKEYGDSAAKSKEFQKSQQELKDEQIANLESIRDTIDTTTEAGAAAAAIIDKQIEKTKLAGTAAKETGGLVKSLFKDTFLDAAKTAIQAVDELNKVAFENTINRLEQEKAKISERAGFEEDVLKSQLESQLISQEEYASRLEQIKKKEIQRQNAIDRKIFEEQNKRDKQAALVDYLTSLASIVPNLIITEKDADPVKIALKAAITAGLATAAYGAEVAAIGKRQFFPKKFADGGLVDGPSHSQGGVPFTVRGVGGYEMEGGEYIVNKESTAKYKSLLDQINETKYTPKYKFATGGIVNAQELSVRQLDLLEAIAEATTGTAINTGRPMRSFVSSDDLRNDNNARRIKERNSNI